MQIDHPILQLKNVSISYTPGKNAVNHVNADIKKNRITAIMGPSGCGKSTLLRAINRMHELYPDIRIDRMLGPLFLQLLHGQSLEQLLFPLEIGLQRG